MYSKVYDDGSMIQYGYEPYSGRLSRITDEQNQYKTRTYNVDGTLAGITYLNAVHSTPNVSYTYDPDYRRIIQMVDGIGTTGYTYNAIASGTLGAGQLASVDGPLPNDGLTYSYDQLGRNTGYAINGVGETRFFDVIGRLLTVVNPLGTFGYSYVRCDWADERRDVSERHDLWLRLFSSHRRFPAHGHHLHAVRRHPTF